jgi:CRP/FNR family transcriptional regulator, cyclic AMP receptor protein
VTLVIPAEEKRFDPDAFLATIAKGRTIEENLINRVLQQEHAFSDMFVTYLLTRNIRYEEDFVDKLFNSSEKRLARILLLLANFDKEVKPEA